MKNIIIGTAGHIDHGKTTLIKAITGRNTDRLKEEKERGITIELGFTYFDLPSGRRAGIIDVPGHEKFIKNMLAGVMGMDIVALVIAADEGIMPQTKEHLDILNLLDIKVGMVVITKADTVEEEWLELVTEDIRECLQDTFLENSPIVPVSSISGSGIKEVIDTIDILTEKVEERDDTDTPRLPIDRVFSMSGFGTIVTGTLISGKLQVGDEVQIYPSDITSKIRSIQVHGVDSSTAYGGQRVAINLAGVKKSEIDRGNIIAPIDSMKETMMLDVKLSLLKDSPRIIENRTRVRLFIGTSEVLCRVVLLDKENLTPGESCYAQLRLEEKIIAKREDKFIIRFYSPTTTIGGGVVLESVPNKRKRFQEEVIHELKLKENEDEVTVLENIIKEKSKVYPDLKELSMLMVKPIEKISSYVNDLSMKSKVLTFELLNSTHVIHIDFYKKQVDFIVEFLKEYHINNPLKSGILKEELRSKFLKSIKPKIGDLVLSKMVQDKIIKKVNENIALNGFEIKFSKLHSEIRDYIMASYLKSEFKPLKKDEIINDCKFNKDDFNKVYEALIDTYLIKLNDEIILHKDIFENGKSKVIKYINENESIIATQVRELLNTNRKCAIAYLEYLDKIKVTKRIDDKRILY